MILGADVGGTFTDVVVVGEGVMTTAKLPTTAVQSDAIVAGATALARGVGIESFIHGTTVATNTLLEGTGARTFLITDDGFEDVLEIGRQDRPSLYDSDVDRPTPLVERANRVAATGALDAVLTAEAVAISLVFGHDQPGSEALILERLRSLGYRGPISLSSTVAPEFREFERTSTTVLNAYLTPSSERYLAMLRETLVDTGVVEHMAVMRSSGGLISDADAARTPSAILLSGPAGGVAATAAFAAQHEHSRVVSFDMGGTSTDVCRIEDGAFDISYERSVGGYVCRLPAAAIHTVGAGGGSIAWIDGGGALRVGPQSAGANPGPACYQNGGTEPTVTDANVVLGRIGPDAALGGSLHIDGALAATAIEPIAHSLGISLQAAALGIVAVAEDVMGRAIRTVSIEEGADPRGAYLYAFGGAGGLHATSLARSLGMAGVVFPPHGGVFSALGLLLAPPRADVAQSAFVGGDDLGDLRSTFDEIETNAVAQLADAGHEVDVISFAVDVRYLGQSHEIAVAYDRGEAASVVRERFDAAHHRRNGFHRAGDPIEIVTVRCTATGSPSLTLNDLPSIGNPTPKEAHYRAVCTADGEASASVLYRATLETGRRIHGPAVIEEDEATIFLSEGDAACVLADGSIEVAL